MSRELGLGVAISIVVGNVIGSGIFNKPGVIALYGGNVPTILAGWVACGVLCLFGALCFAELSAMLPHAGGLYVFIREAYGRPAAFLFGVNEYAIGRPASIGALAHYAAFLIGNMILPHDMQLTAWGQAVLAVGLIVPFAMVNIFGVYWGGLVQGGSTLVKAGFVGLLALLPFVLWVFQAPVSVKWSNFLTTSIPPEGATFGMRFAAVMLAMMWAYNGWHDVAPVAEEIKNPQRNVPLSLILGVILLVFLYAGANLAYHAVLSLEEVAQAKMAAPQEMIRRLFAPWGAGVSSGMIAVMSLVILCSVLGAVNSNLLLGPRIAFAMGRDNLAPQILGTVHAAWRTPAASIALQALLGAGFVLLVTYLQKNVDLFAEINVFDFLTDTVVYCASVFYFLCVVAVYVFRFRNPHWTRPYRTWGYPVTPAFFAASYVVFLYFAWLAKPLESISGIVLIVAAVPLYFLWQQLGSRSLPDAPKAP